MVPTNANEIMVDQALPRTRGDGPYANLINLRDAFFAPHTRGWSRQDVAARLMPDLCPAHAGMVPGPKTHAFRDPALPRTRGDGPPARLNGPWKISLPRTRGDGPGLVARPFASESFASYAGECNDRLKINFHPLEDGIGGVTGEYRLPFAPQLSA